MLQIIISINLPPLEPVCGRAVLWWRPTQLVE